MSERIYLKALCIRVIEEHTQFAYGGEATPNEAFVSQVDEMLEGFTDIDMPTGLDNLYSLVGKFADLWKAWRAHVVDDELALPSKEVWTALHAVEDVIAELEGGSPKVIESIKELDRQQRHSGGTLTDAQICRMYEWVDASGDLELWRLREERESPGKHIPADYVHPAEKKRRGKLAAKKQKMVELHQRSILKCEALMASAPESLADMVAQKLSARQMANMMHCSVADVVAACAAQGLDTPPTDYDSTTTMRAPHEQKLSDAANRSFDAGASVNVGGLLEQENDPDPPPQPPFDESEPTPVVPADMTDMTTDQRVVALHKQGKGATEIAKEVHAMGDAISWQKAKAIIKRYEANPELFE